MATQLGHRYLQVAPVAGGGYVAGRFRQGGGTMRAYGRLFVPILVFAVVLVSALPAMADAAWQPLGSLSVGTGPVEYPGVAVDASGNSVFVWQRLDGTTNCGGGPCLRIQTRSRSVAGVLSSIQSLSPSGRNASLPQVAVNPNGNAVFVWQSSDGTYLRIQTRSRSAAGTLSPTLTLSAPYQSAVYPQLAVDAYGNAAFVWERWDGTNERIQVRTLSAAGVRGSTQTLSAAGGEAMFPQVAVDPSGNAVFAWLGPNGVAQVVKARARSAAGTLSSTQTLSDLGQHAFEPRVALDRSGNAVFLWQRSVGFWNGVQTRARSAAGTLSPTQTLGDTGTVIPLGAQLAVDPQGNAMVVWEHRAGTADCCAQIEARVRLADGTLGSTQFLSSADQVARYPAVAVDPDGEAVVVWAETTTGSARLPDSTIHAAVGSY